MIMSNRMVKMCRTALFFGAAVAGTLSAAEPSADSGSAPAGGLWNTFRLYCLRYLLFVLGAAGAGLTEVLLRTLFCRLLP